MHNIWKNKKWIILFVWFLVIKTVSYFPSVVEKYYTYGFYPFISKIQRVCFGWISFSMGDILYAVAIIYLGYIIIKFCIQIFKKNISRSVFKRSGLRLLYVLLFIYLIFYTLWGMNYYRTGIASQLQLVEKKYSVNDLDTLAGLLHARLNEQAAALTPVMRDSFTSKKALFTGAVGAYQSICKQYPFLKYKSASVKPSLFSYPGNYLGFQGYYNPFSGEAQVNTLMPASVAPFVVTHEIAHQLGYAKESEANFVGFLACRAQPSTDFKYAVYFDMYHYAIRELYYRDSMQVKRYDSTLHPQVKKDIAFYRAFYEKYTNPVEPVITWIYGRYLKANRQPKGNKSYNEVVTWLIAYYKKYGKDVI